MKKGLGAELFKAVERDQGFAFISDGLDSCDDATVIAVARGSLIYSRRVVKTLERWLKKHSAPRVSARMVDRKPRAAITVPVRHLEDFVE